MEIPEFKLYRILRLIKFVERIYHLCRRKLEAIQTQASQHLVRGFLPLLPHIHTPQVMYSQNMQAQREVPPMDHCSSQCLLSSILLIMLPSCLPVDDSFSPSLWI